MLVDFYEYGKCLSRHKRLNRLGLRRFCVFVRNKKTIQESSFFIDKSFCPAILEEVYCVSYFLQDL